MKILIIDYLPDSDTAEIAITATSAGHAVGIASALPPSDSRIRRNITIGNSLDRSLHNLLGSISDSKHLHSTRPTSALLNHIAETDPDIVHIHDIDHGYLNLPLMAYVMTRYKIPVLLTIGDPDRMYCHERALIKRPQYNLTLFESVLSGWELLHFAVTRREYADHQLTMHHPCYTLPDKDQAAAYLAIYENIG